MTRHYISYTKSLLFLLTLLLLLSSVSAAELTKDTNASAITQDNIRQGANAPNILQNATASNILVVYPKPDSLIAASSTFLIGSCPPNSSLLCNGQNVRLNINGYFAHVVELKPGLNKFELRCSLTPNASKQILVKRESAPQGLPSTPLKFAAESAEPREDMGLTAGDILGLAIRATPGCRLSAIIGNHRIALSSISQLKKKNQSADNRGLDAAYGLSFQRYPPHASDLYCGFLRVNSNDHWRGIHPKFILTQNNQSIIFNAPSHITTTEQPLIAETLHNDTIVRLGPGQARTTPLSAGVRLLVDGWQGNSMRCLLNPGRHVWILKEELSLDAHSPFPPASTVRTINIQPENNGAKIIVPLSQRLPYQIEQHLNPSRLVLRIFGATADTDWITETPTQSKALIENVTWKQAQDRVYELTAHLSSNRQWGFWADYDNSNLILHIKGPPPAVPGPNPLSQLCITIDPGHGGDEPGSIGPSGIPESQINLDIALALKARLQHLGARVIMTRTTESEGPSLAERVAIAINAKSDILLSVHNNALPDGRNPWTEHGTSSYWYHPQAIELARTLKEELVKELGFPNFGTSYQNLALTRPSNMLSTLVEVGFMINPDEYTQLITKETQERAAEALSRGILRYLNKPEP